MSRLMKIGKFVLPRSRLACCFLRGNGCGRGPTRKMSLRNHLFAFGGAIIRSTPKQIGGEGRRRVQLGKLASRQAHHVRRGHFALVRFEAGTPPGP